MNSLIGSGVEHMKFLTFGTPLNKMKHPKAAMLIFVFYVAKKNFKHQDSENNYCQIHFVDFMTSLDSELVPT